MIKKKSLLRSLVILACVLGVSTEFSMTEAVAAQSSFDGRAVQNVGWGDMQQGSANKSGSSNSNSGWGSSQSQSQSQGQPQSGGFSWGSGTSHQQSNTIIQQSQAPAQSSNFAMPDPYTRISSSELRNIVKQSRGKVVLVNFFASWCGPCRQEIPALKSLRNKISQDDLVIVGVSIDSNKSDLTKVIRDMQFNYPTVWASDELSRTYNITSIPRLIIYDRDGMLVTDDTGLVPQDALYNFIKAIVNY